MDSPHSIQIHCDGAMDYDSKQTGGNGFIIVFPDHFEIEPISRSIRNDKQGIHRLEMISLIEAMEETISFLNTNNEVAKQSAGVEIYTDRFSVTDGELINPFKVRVWRRAGWKNYEGKPVKNTDLFDKIDKTRQKLSKIVGGSVTISFKPRKKNKMADKLAKKSKMITNTGRSIIKKNDRRVIKRIFDGEEVNYSALSDDNEMEVRVYAWQPVEKEFEICFEICSGDFKGKVIKTSVTANEKSLLLRGHFYLIEIVAVFNHHVKISILDEIKRP